MAVLKNPPSIFWTYPEPVPNPFRAPEPLPRAWMRGGGKLQIDKLSRTRAETIFILGKALRSRYMISNKKKHNNKICEVCDHGSGRGSLVTFEAVMRLKSFCLRKLFTSFQAVMHLVPLHNA